MTEKNKKWKIEIVSFADKNNLSDDQINTIFTCYNHNEYQNFINEIRKKDKVQYDNVPQAKWQLKKSHDIEKMWHNNIDYTIDDVVVKVCINLKINFPIDFDKNDVIEWIEGFNRLNQVYCFVQIEEVVKSSEYIPDKNGNIFLKELIKNQKFIVK